MTKRGEGLPSLLANRSFRLFWFGKTFSEVGSGITLLVAPLIAVKIMSASVFQVSILQAANSLAFLLAGLPLGVILDRYRKRTSMIMADTIRAVLIVVAALAALSGHLDVAGLAVTIVLVGVGTVAYEGACQALVPQLVPQAQLVDANGKLGATWSVALVSGPAIGGVLVATVGLSQALFFDAASYLVSAACLLLLPLKEPRPQRVVDATAPHPLAELVTGLRYIKRDRNLTALLAAGTFLNFFAQFVFAVEVIFLVRELGVPMALVAVPFSLATCGGIAGGLMAGRLAARFGTARVLWAVPMSTVWAMLLLPLAWSGAGVVLYVIGVTGFFAGAAVLSSGHDAYTQAVCPPHMLARVASTNRWATWGIMPVGALVGGLLATQFGVRPILLIGAVGAWASTFLILGSPLRRQRDYAVPEQPAEVTV